MAQSTAQTGCEPIMNSGELNWPLDRTAIAESLKHHSAAEVVGEVYLHLRLPVFSYLHATLGCAQDAEDLTQDVFIRLYQELERGANIRNLRPWIFSVAHNLAMDSHRRDHQSDVSAATEGAVSGSDPEHLLLGEERHRRVSAALKRLSSRERQCLELRAEGLRYREIADALQVSIPSVQSFLCRAVAKLKEDS
jgi:RNA polymerase sigma-70 factor (ECF subfamily)